MLILVKILFLTFILNKVQIFIFSILFDLKGTDVLLNFSFKIFSLLESVIVLLFIDLTLLEINELPIPIINDFLTNGYEIN